MLSHSKQGTRLIHGHNLCRQRNDLLDPQTDNSYSANSYLGGITAGDQSEVNDGDVFMGVQICRHQLGQSLEMAECLMVFNFCWQFIWSLTRLQVLRVKHARYEIT